MALKLIIVAKELNSLDDKIAEEKRKGKKKDKELLKIYTSQFSALRKYLNVIAKFV